MKIEQVLRDFGLEDKEPEIYLELLKLSGAQAASVIAQRANMNRTTVYKTLMKLAKMGLVTKTMKHGIICFMAEDPDKRLETLLIKRKEELGFLSKSLMDILPVIKGMQRQETLIPRMRYYEGLEGTKRVYEDTLMENETIYSFENVEHMAPAIREYLFYSYLPRRVEKGIFAHVITPKNPDNMKFRATDRKNHRQTKFIKNMNFPMEIELNVYGEKTAFFSFKEEEMFGVILESRAIANSMKAIFNLCWKIAE